MALVDLLEISKQYEAQKIFESVNFHIDKNERVAVVGRNGAGKSTLLKIVMGAEDFDEGKKMAQQNLDIKMLPQQPEFEPGQTVKEAIEAQLSELKKAQQEYEVLSAQMAEDFENQSLMERHTELSAFLDTHSAWDLENKIQRILQEFELEEFQDKPANLLSGGEQKRVALAGLLLKKPDILLLDEPTNHLDVTMVEFLEDLLVNDNFTLLFISHDRYFIDNIATRTIEVEDLKLRSFNGGYNSYLHQKEELMHAMSKQHENLLKFLKQEEEWLARGVRARIKRNEGRKERVMKLRTEAKKNPGMLRKMQLELEREKKHFNRDKSVNKQKMLFEVENLDKALGGKRLIQDFSTRILQHDKIAIVGRNGSGKSTLLKLLLDDLKPDSGKIKRGDVRFGYFSQHRENLDPDKNLIETFCPNGGDRVDVRGKSIHVYGYLKQFLFPKEFLDKKINALSGGERNRVALALLFTKEVDCLILDEPTNDLDIPTINILEENLMTFGGALLFVSHDRYFVDKIAQKLLIFKGNGEIEENYCSFTEYLEIEKELRSLADYEKELEKEQNKPDTPKPKKQTKLSYKEQRLYEELPAEIETLESEIEALNACLSNPECYAEKGITAVAEELEGKKQIYEEKVEQFLELEEKKEALERG